MDLGQLEGNNSFLIHFECIINILGFGLYLRSLDSQMRSWEWQVQNVIIFCQIHLQRSIDRAAGSQGRSTVSIHTRMFELVKCQTREDYDLLCDEIIGINGFRIHSKYITNILGHPDSTRSVRKWAQHKKRAVIASGINKACSLIASDLWDQTTCHTNAVEQTHFKSNSLGRRLTLLKAIQ
jgi:hypothetical protein